MKDFDPPAFWDAFCSIEKPSSISSVSVLEFLSLSYVSILFNDFYGFNSCYFEPSSFQLVNKSHCYMKKFHEKKISQISKRLKKKKQISKKKHSKKFILFEFFVFLLSCSIFPLNTYGKPQNVFMIEKYRNYYPYKNSSARTKRVPNQLILAKDENNTMLRPQFTVDGTPSSSSSLPFAYGGGREKSYILENPISVYIIWYGNWTYKGAEKDRKVLTTFLDSLSYEYPLSMTDATVNRWWNVVRVYYNPYSGKHVSGNVTRAKEVFDDFSFGLNLSQTMVGELIDSHIRKKRLPVDRNGIYIVFVSGEVCYRGSSWTKVGAAKPCKVCLGCAFHGYFQRSTGKNAYNLTYAYVANGFSGLAICGPTCMPRYAGDTQTVNKNKGIDLMVNLLAHELAEASTDMRAYGEGWAHVEDRFWEIADMCQNTFMPEFFTEDLTSKFNLVGKGGMRFLVQRVFHLYRGCTIRAKLKDTFSPPNSVPPPSAKQSPKPPIQPPGKYKLIPPHSKPPSATPPHHKTENPPPKKILPPPR